MNTGQLILIEKNLSNHNMRDLINNLKVYKMSSIISIGANLIWQSFFNNNFSKNEAFYLQTCGSRIIFLGIAVAGENSKIWMSKNDFVNLCSLYFNMGSLNEAGLKEEAKILLKHLESLDEEYNTLKKYLSLDIISESCKASIIARYSRMQSLGHLINLNELYRAYHFLSFLNIKTNFKVSKIFNSIFQINIIDFFRSVLCITSKLKEFHKITFRDSDLKIENLVPSWNINVKTCQLVCSKLSHDQNFIRDIWYKKFSNIEIEYQKYFSEPALAKPLIAETPGEFNNFFIINPKLFISGVVNSIFSDLFLNEKNKEFTGEFGLIVENHIQAVLKRIFGDDKVHKIQHEGKKADLYVEHEICDFIFEVKSSLGGYESLSLMTPISIVDIWKRLYDASVQCSYSLKEYKKSNKTIIPIILIADHIFFEFMSFHFFADSSGLFNELRIDFIEFYSWNQLEHLLSIKPVEDFIKEIFVRKKLELPSFENKLLYTPAHNYEYFKDVEHELRGNS